jgi:hypothetical protein
VQTLNDKNLGGLDELRWVEEASDVVVDWLLDCLSFFDRLLVGPWVEGSYTFILAPISFFRALIEYKLD